MDESFNIIKILDMFESLIWTERYNGAGNFELYMPTNAISLELIFDIISKLEKGIETYLWLKESKTHMIIETVEITTNVETGNHVIITGRGLESILERRIVWKQTILRIRLQSEMLSLINDAIIKPKESDRKIPNFRFFYVSDSVIPPIRVSHQYTGDNLYDVIYELCHEQGWGFDVYVDENDNNFVFKLRIGKDYSYDQEENPYIVFSPKFDNLNNTDYIESPTTLKNVALVAGEDDGTSRRTKVVGSASGLARRELYVDARDLQSEVGDDVISDDEYYNLLEQRGFTKLSEHQYTKAFTGEIEPRKSFVFGEDFAIGDIVQIINEYGMSSKVRVVEMVRTYDTDGYRLYPTFEVVQ